MSHDWPSPMHIPVPPYGAPSIDPAAWCAPGAVVAGDVTIGAASSVWYGAVVRGDTSSVRIGERSNVQDNAVIHTLRDHDAVIGNGVSIGHGAVVHGATIEDECLIGMNATVLSGAVIGRGSLIGAGTLVPEGFVVPPRSLVIGVPGRVKRELREEEVESVRMNGIRYLEIAANHAAATRAL